MGRARSTSGARAWGSAYALLAGLALGAPLPGCQGPNRARPIEPSRDLWDPSPDRRTRSVREVLRQGDRGQLEALVRLLDDPDPGVRLMASGSLEELTGRTSDYRPYMDAAERRPHIEAWRAWIRGEDDVVPASVAPEAGDSIPAEPSAAPDTGGAAGEPSEPAPPPAPPPLPEPDDATGDTP